MRMLSPVLRVPALRVPVLLLFIALLWHNQALSETTIDLGNGSALSFQSGSLSQDYSTADLTGITLTENGTTLLTAGRFQ